ncbi:MAG TPA: ABC transporter ATP-binding protein [Bryobacteraceae bacterium]|nr:ABC transporter ATP-binding protein [Bryobacteraceae bacterium]
MGNCALLSTRLSAGYPGRPGVLQQASLAISQGEIVGLVGESGSGKSTMALAILRLLQYRGGTLNGEVRFGDRNLLEISEKEMRRIRGRDIGLVLQSPIASLNPAMRIGEQIYESWRAHKEEYSRPFTWADAIQLLYRVSLAADEPFLRRYPRQLSVGQAQRVLIAMAIVHQPRLLIADEPTSALDAVTHSEILHLFSRLSREMEMGILFISHDLLSVSSICSRVAILSAGRVVEFDSTEAIFRRPAHDYTRALIRSIPTLPAGVYASRIRRHDAGEWLGEAVPAFGGVDEGDPRLAPANALEAVAISGGR